MLLVIVLCGVDSIALVAAALLHTIDPHEHDTFVEFRLVHHFGRLISL
jgi:hypothetical protein